MDVLREWALVQEEMARAEEDERKRMHREGERERLRAERRRARVTGFVGRMLVDWFRGEVWPKCLAADAKKQRRLIDEANIRQAARFCKKVQPPKTTLQDLEQIVTEDPLMMTKMEYLRLHKTQITDEGLIHLKGMTNLSRVDVYGSNISSKGVAQLREWFPNCYIKTRE